MRETEGSGMWGGHVVARGSEGDRSIWSTRRLVFVADDLLDIRCMYVYQVG